MSDAAAWLRTAILTDIRKAHGPVALPLASARVCLDDDTLTDATACPRCCSPTFPISRWLERKAG